MNLFVLYQIQKSCGFGYEFRERLLLVWSSLLSIDIKWSKFCKFLKDERISRYIRGISHISFTVIPKRKKNVMEVQTKQEILQVCFHLKGFLIM